MTFWKPSKYPGQDERLEKEMKETQANQYLCSQAPQMLEILKELVELERKYFNDNLLIKNISIRAESIIKEATEL